MKKIEYRKCEKTMIQAIIKANEAKTEFATVQKCERNGQTETTEYEIAMRKGDRYYGEAEGIRFVLESIGFKHERMEELNELI